MVATLASQPAQTTDKTAEKTAETHLAPPESELGYAHVYEDPALELSLVEMLAKELGRPLRVAVVASGGCTALSLLSSEHVARVDAIDLNPAQLHLVELKRRAIEHLDLDKQRVLLGHDDDASEEGAERRFKLYERLREHLVDPARDYWDTRQAEIGYGLVRVARFERLCRELADAFRDEGLDPLSRPSEALGHPAWRTIFHRVFEPNRLALSFGTAAVAYSSELPMGAHFSQRIAEALRRKAGAPSYFLTHVFPRPGDDGPPCMQADVQQGMKRQGLERLHLHRGPLLGCLRELSESVPFDLIQTSDVTDWLPQTERNALVRTVKESLVAGGALLARRLNGDGDLAPLVAHHLELDAAMSASFLERERSFLYREVVVARRRPV